MGCARWRGVRLANVLEAAQPKAEARQVLLNGLDRPLLPQSPDFLKTLEMEEATQPEVLLAWEMNGEPLPWLNGYPLRLVVPGFYGTYWVKHLNEITLIETPYQGFYMNPAYRIPEDPCAHVEPGTIPRKTVPIQRLNVRSFITNLKPGASVETGKVRQIRGIAFDGGFNLQEVLFSADHGERWQRAKLGPDLGKYAFREWTVDWAPPKSGAHNLMVKATKRLGQSQPSEPLWNPAGYMRNVIETVQVVAT
jgi:DMSO/TMAO reductase YedYZ molybdopterin-dependent catalytic subunit